MALDFPSSPTIGQIYYDFNSGFFFEWDGSAWKSYSPLSSSNIKILDDISESFNGIETSFLLTNGGNLLYPPSSASLIINLGGIVQDPSDDYSVSGNNIVFSTPPIAGLTFSGISLGPAVPISTILDGAVTEGSLRISTQAVVGSATTFTEDLVVEGDARITGILTVGNLNVNSNLIGIALSSSVSDTYADNSGISIYGDTNKTLTYNNTKKGFEFNIPLSTNETRLITGSEKVVRVSGNIVDLVYNSSSSSNIGYSTNPTGNISLSVTGIPTSSDFDDHSITFAVIVNSTGTARTCTSVSLNGVSKTISWSGGSLGSALAGVTTTNGHTIFSFTGINTIGSAGTTQNYNVFGTVSGGFW